MADDFGRTALMFAAIDGYSKIADVLLKYRSDVNAVDKEGNTALLLAVRGNHESVVRVLMAGCPNLDAKDRSGKTATQWAEMKSNYRILEHLKSAVPCN